MNGNDVSSESDEYAVVDKGTRKSSNSARCLFCGANETQLPRHMRLKHGKEPDVLKILVTQGDDAETKLKDECGVWCALLARGDFAYSKRNDTQIWARKYETAHDRKAKTLPCPRCKYEYATPHT